MERNTQFIGQSTAFLDALDRTSQAATLDRPVLVVGERGTGKELIAERLHRLSLRWDGPLVTMNCAALPETLIEAELFGHEAGAFTGATKARAGRFEEADGGTLFLDELGTLSMGAQERLLRAVEYGEINRIGSSNAISVDVRIVGATNENLPHMVEQHKFRADLLDRLSFEVITLPPLRAREGDIDVLADHFGRRMAAELSWDGWPGFDSQAKHALEIYTWPGNVRELRNVVERAVYRAGNATIPINHIEFDPFKSVWSPSGANSSSPNTNEQRITKDHGISEGVPINTADNAIGSADENSSPAFDTSHIDDFRKASETYEKMILEAAMEKHRYNQRQTAAALNLSYDQLRHCLKKYDMLG